MTGFLDGREVCSGAAFHSLIAQILGFPAHYGRNLDALYDCLTELPDGTELVICHFDALRENLGEVCAGRILRVLSDAAGEGRFRFRCE